MKISRSYLGVALALSLASCGPTGLVLGVSDLGSENRETVFLVFVNDNAEQVLLRVNGTAFSVSGLSVPPGQTMRVAVPRGEALRVRANDLPNETTQAPLAWDYRLVASATENTSRFSAEAAVFSSRFAKTSSGDDQDVVDLQRFNTQTLNFEQIGQWDFGFVPNRVCLHPSGAYVYAVRDTATNSAEIIAFRVDLTAGLQQVAPEFGSNPTNPVGFTFADSFECVLDPRGRFFYLLDHDDSETRTRITVFGVAQDGSLVRGRTLLRGRIASMVVAPDGNTAYIAEDVGSGHVIRALRIGTANGEFAFQVNEAATPCNANQPAPPRLFMHPQGKFAYAVVTDTGKERLGSYFLFSDGSIFANSQCLALDRVDDVSFDPRGDVLLITGRNDSGTDGLLRYSIQQTTGALTLLGTQVFTSALERISSIANPGLSDSDPLKFLSFLTQGSSLVPHTRGPNATQEPVTRSDNSVPSLPFGDSTTTRLTTAIRRGNVAITQ